MNISYVLTVPASRYDLDQVSGSDHEGEIAKFVELLTRHRHVLYDWGQHMLYVCVAPFAMDYDKKAVIATDGQSDLAALDSWIGCDPNSLHDHLLPFFEGEWGPSAADTLVRLERSGVRVDICNTSEYGPEDPKNYVEKLRQTCAQ